jgi:hypothetical protein
MALLWPQNGEPERFLTEHDLLRAHIAAAHVLAAWQARDVEYWRRAAVGWLIGAVIPLVGCFVLHWPIATVIVALALDIPALWACDVLKGLLAPQRARQEQAHLDEAAEVREVMTSLQRPRRPSALQRDLLAATPRVGYYYSPPGPAGQPPPGLAVLLLLLLGGLLALGLVSAHHFLPGTLPWLVLGLGLRFAVSILSTWRARRRVDPAPVLLPEAPGPMFAVGVTLMVCLVLMKTGGDAITSLPSTWIGTGVLVLHFVAVLAVSRWALGNVRDFISDLRRFAAQDRESLRERVLRVNGGA